MYKRQVNTDPVPNTITFNISPVNDAPVASGIEPVPLIYVENSGSTVISSALALADIDNTNLAGATVEIGNYVNGKDILLFGDTADITHAWDPVSGILTLTGTDTVANYQAALRSVVYENNSNSPVAGPRIISFTVTDGDLESNVETRVINVEAVNDVPTLSSIEAQPSSYTENGFAVGITGNLNITDLDDAEIESATITISNNYVPGEDILTFNPHPDITGVFSNGTLTLTGSASQTDYETVIHSVFYGNTSNNPSDATRTVLITINDGDDDSNTLSRDVEINPVNDAPIESGIESIPLFYFENSGAVVVSNTVSLFDIDDGNLESATVQLGDYVIGQDVLFFADTPDIISAWDPVNGSLTLSGTDTVANYQAALRSVTYENTSDDPVFTPRSVSFTVFDGDDNSNIESRVINVAAINDAPVLSSIEALPANYTENGVPASVTGNLSIDDPDDTQIESATVTISNFFNGDDLSFTSLFGITGSFVGDTLSLSGSASLAQYEACLLYTSDAADE